MSTQTAPPSDVGRALSAAWVQTISEANLRDHRKNQNLNKDNSAAVRRMHDLGVMVNASFVFGKDDDDLTVFDRTVEWAVDHGVETATFHILTPYPSAGLYPADRGQGPTVAP